MDESSQRIFVVTNVACRCPSSESGHRPAAFIERRAQLDFLPQVFNQPFGGSYAYQKAGRAKKA